MKSSLLTQLRERAAGVRRRIVYPEAHDSRVLQAARTIADTGIAIPLLVGAPDTVARALLAYYKIGATSLLIRGYEPLEDAEQYGAELIPIVRRLVAEADAAAEKR